MRKTRSRPSTITGSALADFAKMKAAVYLAAGRLIDSDIPPKRALSKKEARAASKAEIDGKKVLKGQHYYLVNTPNGLKTMKVRYG